PRGDPRISARRPRRPAAQAHRAAGAGAAACASVRAHHPYRALVPRARLQRNRAGGPAAAEARAVQHPAALQGARQEPMKKRGRPVVESAPAPAAAAATVVAEDLLPLIADSLHGIEAVFDGDFRLLWISPSIEGLSGWSAADCLQAADALELLIDDSDLAFCRNAAAQVLASGAAQDFELRLATRDGSGRWLLMHWRRRED